MDWNIYRNTYLNYQQSVSETRIISFVAGEVLKDFPKNLPIKLRKKSNKILLKTVKAIGELLEEKDLLEKEKTVCDFYEKSSKNEDTNDDINDGVDYVSANIASEILFVAISQVGKKQTAIFDNLNFQRLQYFQGLIMHFANFEAILADSLRAICYTRPEVMRSKNEIKWEEVLSVKSWDELLGMLTEKFVFDLGWESLEDRVKFFVKRFGLKIELKEEDVITLREIEIIRNLIVHNGGKINAEYLQLKPTEGLKVGDYIPLDTDFLQNISSTLLSLASEIYLEISKNFFKIGEDEAIGCISTRRK